MPESPKTLPQHIPIMCKCLIIAALLKARLSKFARCCTVNIVPARPSFSYSCLRQSHAERAHKPLFARWALITGDRSVPVRLYHARHMDVACCAPARAPSQQLPAGFQTHPADRGVCAHAIGPRPRTLGARGIAGTRVGRAAAPLLGLATRRRGFALALVLLPVSRLAGSGAVPRFLAAAAQMRRDLAATTRAVRHCLMSVYRRMGGYTQLGIRAATPSPFRRACSAALRPRAAASRAACFSFFLRQRLSDRVQLRQPISD